jgi:hypothetical protein
MLRHRLLILLGCTVALTTTALARDTLRDTAPIVRNPRIIKATDDYKNCILETARRLGSGTDAADLIARSAVVACKKELSKLLGSPANAKVGFDLATRAEHDAVNDATLEILSKRAAK